MNKEKEEFIFCPLGGSGEIGMNMNLFAYGSPEKRNWIIVDIGVTFADETIPGIVSSAKVTPISTIIHFLVSWLPQANKFMFIPISPDPPRGQKINSSFFI